MEGKDSGDSGKPGSSKAPQKPINNQLLAAMLRESASFVERGEFDPILYTALQDFRSYYKIHYPKKKSKKAPRKDRSPEKAAKMGSIEATRAQEGSATATEGQPGAPDLLAEASRETSFPSHETATSNQPTAGLSAHHDEERMGRRGPPASPQAGSERDLREAETPPTTKGTAATVSTPTGSAPETSPSFFSSPTTLQKATAGTLFGKLKFPTMKVSLANTTAFAATSKKNADRAKEDLSAFQDFHGALAQQAESSGRRKALADSTTLTEASPSEPLSGNFSAAGPAQATPMTEGSMTPHGGDRGKGHHHNAAAASGAAADPLLVGLTGLATTSTATKSTKSTKSTTRSTTKSAPSSTKSASQSGLTSAEEADSEGSDEGGEGRRMPRDSTKPDFQRPLNANSSLVANGWIEQQRRSKMRVVWKEVLASLVQARKPGEETTLWIQRETINAVSGKKELEALHQIPVKLLENCSYLEYSADNRFTLKLFNATEDFIFRCNTDVAAMNWVLTLQKHEKIAKARDGKKEPSAASANPQKTSRSTNPFEDEKKGDSPPPQQPPKMSISELRAICHGAGINTAGMERGQLEASAEEVRKRGTYFAPPSASQPPPVPQPAGTQPNPKPQPTTKPPSESTDTKLSIGELRAICHGGGINTAGMERRQLEKAAEEVQKRGTYFPAPQGQAYPQPSASTPAPQHQAPQQQQQQQPARAPSPAPAAAAKDARMTISELRAICHGAGINTAGMERGQLEKAAEEVRKRGTYFDPPVPSQAQPPSHAAQEEQRRKQEAEAQRREAEEKRRRAQEDYHRQMQMEEENRRRAEEEVRQKRMEEEQRRKRMEEESRRRMAELEQQRRMAEQQAAEQRRRYAEQQAQWQKQHQEEEQRRRAAEQQAAEQRRRHEEAIRNQQQWQQQWQRQQQQPQHQAQWQQQQKQPQQWPPRQPQQQQQQWQQQQHAHQQHQARAPTPPPQHQQRKPTPPPQPQQQQQQQSAASQKYANMANNQADDDGQAAITRIKHDILIRWALQPPLLQMLRPIDALVTTIHTVFPPALGVTAHDYFKKWKPLARADVCSDTGLAEGEKLKKAVRKIRFFLHPDKLPKDLNPEQAFMVKMLWDVTSDAWEEYEKRKEDLDWIK